MFPDKSITLAEFKRMVETHDGLGHIPTSQQRVMKLFGALGRARATVLTGTVWLLPCKSVPGDCDATNTGFFSQTPQRRCTVGIKCTKTRHSTLSEGL